MAGFLGGIMPGWWRRWRRAARLRRAHRLLNLIDGGDAELSARFRRIASDAVGRHLEERTDAQGRPHDDRLTAALRDLPLTVRNVKTLAARVADQHRATLPDRPPPPRPRTIGLTGRLCRQVDVERPWMHHWLAACGMRPGYHRKAWETAFVLQALWEAGMLAPGRRGLGFAVGREPIPCVLAAHGADILATDLDGTDSRAESWTRTNQNATRVEDLHRPNLIGRDAFLARCRFRPVDMNALPDDLGGFDFAWSSCSFEHLGSIERGLAFVEASMRCLRPGGVAVHTTEFRLDGDGPRLDNAPTVLFRRIDMEALADRLAARGHAMAPIDYGPGRGILDHYVDVPPFGPRAADGFAPPTPPHLRLSVDGIPATSIGLIIRAAG